MHGFLVVLEPFTPAPVVDHKERQGHPLTLNCIPPRSYPKADIFWATIVNNDRFEPIDLTDRVTMDPEGEVYFGCELIFIHQ